MSPPFPMDKSQLPYWEERATRWRFTPPLSPSAEDVAWYEAMAAEGAAAMRGAPLRALLLGVTPAIATMRWPPGTVLTAVDWSEGMIRNVWPTKGTPPGAASLRADWRQLPLRSASVDFVVGDNCAAALGSDGAVVELNRELARVMRPRAMFGTRVVVRPDRALSSSQLFADLAAGRIRQFDFFRFLLAMSVQRDSKEGVSLQEAWRVWSTEGPDSSSLPGSIDAVELGLANFDQWRDSTGRYCFLSRGEFAALAAPSFDLEIGPPPSYRFGEYFARLIFRRGGD